jgi:hypothetical protein
MALFIATKRQRGVAVISITVIVVAIAISSTLAGAKIQQQRLQRSDLALHYQRAKLAVEASQDGLYVVLSQTPSLWQSSPLCSASSANAPLVIAPTISTKYALQGQFFLCAINADNFLLKVQLSTDNGKVKLSVQRQLQRQHGQLQWQHAGSVDF